MALVNCKACGKEIGKGVNKCINCGTDQRNFFGKHKIITGILVILVLGGIGSALGDKDKASTASAPVVSAPTSTQAPAATQQPKAPPMIVTADKLVEDLKANALNASETYKGRYVEVTGQLSTIDSGGKYFSIDPMDGSFTMTNVMCNITQEQKSAVSKFTSKQKVTVVGTMTDVGEVMGYTIKVESIK